MNVQIDIPLVERIAAEIRAALGSDEDDTAFLDTLEGETDAMEAMDQLIAEAMNADSLSAAIKEQVSALAARRNRMEARNAACRVGMLQLLDAIGVKKLERPGATISRRAGLPSVQITDEAAIPSQLCKTVVTPDKAAIKAQLLAGEDVPGARIEIGGDGVTVRVK